MKIIHKIHEICHNFLSNIIALLVDEISVVDVPREYIEFAVSTEVPV